MVVVKPPRLRAACTNCHSAKVKCSGEREGCSRCRLHDLQCEYQVSMVGRAPKRRVARRAGAATDDDDGEASGDANGLSPGECGDRDPEAGLGTSNTLEDVIGMVLDGGVSCQHHHAQFNVLPDDLDPSAFLSQFHTGHMDHHRHRQHHPTPPFMPSSATPQLDLPMTMPDDLLPLFPPVMAGLTLDNTDGSASIASAPTIESSLAATAADRIPSFLRNPSLYSRFGQTGEIMILIEALEAIIQRHSNEANGDDSTNYDDAIRQTRQAMKHISGYVETDSFKQCNACGALVATVADLVRGLYELVGAGWEVWDGGDTRSKDDGDGMGATPDPGTDAASVREATSVKGPQFSLGCLELEPDEQDALRRQLLRRDLKRYVDLVQKCARISKEVAWVGGPKPLGKGPGRLIGVMKTFGSSVQEAWYGDMQQSAQRLLELAGETTPETH